MRIQRSIELSSVYTNKITKKKKRFAIPVVAKIFHKDSHLRISIADSVIGNILKVIRSPVVAPADSHMPVAAFLYVCPAFLYVCLVPALHLDRLEVKIKLMTRLDKQNRL